jgi:hypothetical protein
MNLATAIYSAYKSGSYHDGALAQLSTAHTVATSLHHALLQAQTAATPPATSAVQSAVQLLSQGDGRAINATFHALDILNALLPAADRGLIPFTSN